MSLTLLSGPRFLFGVTEFIPEFPGFITIFRKDIFMTAAQGDRQFFVSPAKLPGHYRLIPKIDGKVRTDRAIGLKASNA